MRMSVESTLIVYIALFCESMFIQAQTDNVQRGYFPGPCRYWCDLVCCIMYSTVADYLIGVRASISLYLYHT